MSLSRVTLLSRRLPAMAYQQKAMYADDGSKDGGAGGGGAGSIREAGGAFGKREAAMEEQYFRKLQGEQLAKLKSHVEKEINHHKEEINRHQEAIEKLKKRSKDLSKESEKK